VLQRYRESDHQQHQLPLLGYAQLPHGVVPFPPVSMASAW
jgi:hypothetical protein